jgi:gliding motility-associated-like protein
MVLTMKNLKKTLITAVIAVITIQSLSAQSNRFQYADKQYELANYRVAADEFAKAYASKQNHKVYGFDLSEKIVQDCSFTIEITVSPPNIVSSRFDGSSRSLTETFNNLAIGNLPTSGEFSIGTFNKTGISSISSSTVSGGTSSPYLSIPNSSSITVFLSQPSRYIGFWWGAANDNSFVKFYGYCGGKEVLLRSINTMDIIKLFSGPTVIAFDGKTYNTSDYRRTNSQALFSYLNIEFKDQNIDLTKIEFIHSDGGAFEVDNITTLSTLQIGPLFIPNVITPNGDKKNDVFVINGLNKFSSNELIIFNRNGDHVFQKKDYQNDWRGEGLVPGTYFYILSALDINGISKEFKGWIQLIRD